MFLICSASRICSFCLLFWCSNNVVFSVRIFRNSVVGHECFFKCCAMELVSERHIVSLFDRGAELNQHIYDFFKSPKGHLDWYITLIFCKTPIEREEQLFLMTKFEVLNWFFFHHTTCENTVSVAVLSPWLAADEARVSHVLSHVIWWKKIKF